MDPGSDSVGSSCMCLCLQSQGCISKGGEKSFTMIITPSWTVPGKAERSQFKFWLISTVLQEGLRSNLRLPSNCKRHSPPSWPARSGEDAQSAKATSGMGWKLRKCQLVWSQNTGTCFQTFLPSFPRLIFKNCHFSLFAGTYMSISTLPYAFVTG